MPLPFGTQKEIDDRNACWKAFSPVIVNITDEPDLGLGLTTRLTFTADQNYVIVGAYISGNLIDFTANPPTFGIIAWTFNPNSLNPALGGTNNGNILASIAVSSYFSSVATNKPNTSPSVGVWDFSKYPFYLSKSSKVFLSIFLANTANSPNYTASLYLLPTFA